MRIAERGRGGGLWLLSEWVSGVRLVVVVIHFGNFFFFFSSTCILDVFLSVSRPLFLYRNSFHSILLLRAFSSASSSCHPLHPDR